MTGRFSDPGGTMGDETAQDHTRRKRRRAAKPSYDPRAYLLVSESMAVTLSRMPERRHLTASECAEGVLWVAAQCFGVLGSTVLECWGIHGSEDVGRIISALVERGEVSMDEEDRIEDFDDLFRLDEDFAARYRIGEGLRARSEGKPHGPW